MGSTSRGLGMAFQKGALLDGTVPLTQRDGKRNYRTAESPSPSGNSLQYLVPRVVQFVLSAFFLF